jgi:hypothetical protein
LPHIAAARFVYDEPRGFFLRRLAETAQNGYNAEFCGGLSSGLLTDWTADLV